MLEYSGMSCFETANDNRCHSLYIHHWQRTTTAATTTIQIKSLLVDDQVKLSHQKPHIVYVMSFEKFIFEMKNKKIQHIATIEA